MKTIGEILKNSREDLDLTQIDVMNLTGIHNKTLSGYENGVSEPDLHTFTALLKLYNLSADEVLGISKRNNKTAVILNSSEYQLISYFKKLSKKQQSDLLTALKALASASDAPPEKKQ